MRVSERQRYHITNTRVGNARGQNASTLEKIATMKRINRLSDDPIGAGQVIRHRDRIDRINEYRSNIEFSKGYLERSETAIKDITENLIRAKELAIGMANDSYDAKGRQAASQEVKQIMNEVTSLANTTFANRYVFSGFRNRTPALAGDGTFLGDDGAIFLQMDDGTFRQVNVQARNLFEATPDERQAGHFNIMDALDVLYLGLNGDHKENIRKGMDELDFQIDKTSSFQATLGSLYKALDAAEGRLELDQEMTKEEKSKVEEVDMFQATSDFHRTESVLQSTLQASNKMLQPSLLNFLQ